MYHNGWLDPCVRTYVKDREAEDEQCLLTELRIKERERKLNRKYSICDFEPAWVKGTLRTRGRGVTSDVDEKCTLDIRRSFMSCLDISLSVV